MKIRDEKARVFVNERLEEVNVLELMCDYLKILCLKKLSISDVEE